MNHSRPKLKTLATKDVLCEILLIAVIHEYKTGKTVTVTAGIIFIEFPLDAR